MDIGQELLTVKLQYRQPGGNTWFASALAAFGMIFRGSEDAGGATLPIVAEIAGGAWGFAAGGYRGEFLDLVRGAARVR